mgnify:CR=1 FL=1
MQIVGQDGQPLIINASDFDASIHKVYGETEAKPQPKAEPKTITMKGRDSGANR